MEPTTLVPRRKRGARPIGPIELRMQITEQTHDALKARAARDGVTIYAAARRILNDALNPPTPTKEK